MLTSGHLVTKTNKELKIKMTLDLRSVFQGSESILFHYLNQAMLAASIPWRTDLTLTQCTDHTALKWIGLLKPSRRPPDSCFLITRKTFVLEISHDLTYSQGSFSHVFCFSVLAPRRRTGNVSCFPQKVAVKKVNFYWPNKSISQASTCSVSACNFHLPHIWKQGVKQQRLQTPHPAPSLDTWTIAFHQPSLQPAPLICWDVLIKLMTMRYDAIGAPPLNCITLQKF